MSTDIAMGHAFDLAVQDLDSLIDRHFVARRTLTVERESEKHWIASINGDVLHRHPDGPFVLRWARTFAERTPGVTVACAPMWEELGHSVRVPAEPLAEVIPLLGKVEA